MTRHQKRLSVPNSWPVERKEGTFTVKAGAGPHGEQGVPLLVILRDVLEYVDSTKEARYALGQDSVLVNGQPVSDEQRPIGMFDILSFLEREEYYRVFPDEGGRLSLTAIDADAADSRLGKVTGKQQVPGGETQLALHDGTTLVTDDEDVAVNDSVVVSNDETDVVAHFPYEEGALVTAVAGTHAGDIGTIDEIQVTASSSPNNVLVDTAEDDGQFETIEEYVVVIDENFTGGSSLSDETAGSTDEESEEAESSEENEAAEAESSAEPDESAHDAEDGGDEQ